MRRSQPTRSDTARGSWTWPERCGRPLPGGRCGASLWRRSAPPLALALVARAVKPLRGIAAGLAFGWAGLLLHAALVRSVYLPILPLWMVPLWLLLGSFIAWWAGRAVVVPERLR